MDDSFRYEQTADGRIFIYRSGKLVTTLSHRDATRFEARIRKADEKEQQRLMARATGQYRFGNERRATRQRNAKRGT